VALKNYAKRVEDLLDEYRQRSGGMIRIKKFDPQPDSEAEDSARLDGIDGRTISQGGLINLGEKIYLGLAVICVDEQVALPFLDPSRERLLEYDLTRAISQVINPEKAGLGVMSALPVFGQFNPMMMQRGAQQTPQPWVAISELKRDFDVREINMDVEQIDDDLNVLVVVHPANISDKAQYAIDQFVLRGGKLIALLDPMSVVDSRNAMGMQNMLQRAAAGGSTMEKLLKSWGLEFDMGKVVADKNNVTMVRGSDNQPRAEATWLSLTPEGINQDDVATSDIDSLLLVGSGAFTGTPAEGLTKDVLLHSSVNSDMVDKMMAQLGADTSKDFTASDKEYALAVRLSGKFKTAFPDGKPDTGEEADSESEEDSESTPADDEAAAKAEHLEESTEDGVVILLGDSDFVYDQFCVQVQPWLGGQRLLIPFNGNLNLLQNFVEQLLGDNRLITVRSRAVQNRPFTRVKEMRAEAEKQYLSKINQLEEDLSETQQKLNELQRAKTEGSQHLILSPEQQEELNRFVKREMEVKRELKTVRRQLRKDIDSLENRLKWLNIAGMPMLVTVVGLTLAMVQRKRTAAK
jgi:ABC-type uncharacterized transport system involved in gliding motility auxiliary subunit